MSFPLQEPFTLAVFAYAWFTSARLPTEIIWIHVHSLVALEATNGGESVANDILHVQRAAGSYSIRHVELTQHLLARQRPAGIARLPRLDGFGVILTVLEIGEQGLAREFARHLPGARGGGGEGAFEFGVDRNFEHRSARDTRLSPVAGASRALFSTGQRTCRTSSAPAGSGRQSSAAGASPVSQRA